MTKVSKYIKLDKDILLEYIYDDSNLINEQYTILVDSRDKKQSYIATDSTITGNDMGNQLFITDSVMLKFSKVNPNYYSFLQAKSYSSGGPVKHDTIKIHIPINWTFGDHLGFYIKIYAFDVNNQKTYDLSNFYFDMTDIGQQYLMNLTSPPLLFQEKLWGKSIDIQIPALNDISNQRSNNLPKQNTINSNLTNGSGFSRTSPIFIDFYYIDDIKTINNVTSYIMSSKVTTTLPQTPEYERMGVKVEHSKNGDFFEIYGIYNGNIAEFNQFLNESYVSGHRYYVQYNITIYEQNIRGKTLTFIQNDNFNETIEFRPIIKNSTTTAIIDVEMRLIDAVDNSQILRRASYGMLQDEVSKYSSNLTKINVKNISKPKIYNIKSNIDPSLVGVSNSMGMINIQGRSRNKGTSVIKQAPIVQFEQVKVPFPVLVDKYNIVSKSDNDTFSNTTFYGIGKMTILLYPFDNILTFVVANGSSESPDFMDLSGHGDIKIVFKNDDKSIEFPLYTESGTIDTSIGMLAFKIDQSKFGDIKKIYDSGVNVFYITSDNQGIRSVLYSSIYKIYNSSSNIIDMNVADKSATPMVIKDPDIKRETAIVTRRAITKESATIIKPQAVRGSGSTNQNQAVRGSGSTNQNQAVRGSSE